MRSKIVMKIVSSILGLIAMLSLWALLDHFFGDFFGQVAVSVMFGFFVSGVVEAIFEDPFTKKESHD